MLEYWSFKRKRKFYCIILVVQNWNKTKALRNLIRCGVGREHLRKNCAGIHTLFAPDILRRRDYWLVAACGCYKYDFFRNILICALIEYVWNFESSLTNSELNDQKQKNWIFAMQYQSKHLTSKLDLRKFKSITQR